jgi:hypothetical protein
MTMFTLYCDASGNPADSPVVFVAGFVSSEEKWLRFEGQWARLLRVNQIEPPFHMTDFASGRGQYESWRADHDRRRAFVREAFVLLKRHTHKSFSVGVMVEALNEIRRHYAVPETSAYPYPIAALGVFKLAHDWLMKRPRDGDRHRFVFEKGDPHQHVFVKLLREIDWPVRPHFQSKASCIRLQAADFIAWQHARAARCAIQRATWGDILDEFSASHNLLASDAWVIIDRPQLLATCTRRGWGLRPAPSL